MHFFKHSLAFLLAAILLLSAVSCGSGNNDPQGSESLSESETSSVESESESESESETETETEEETVCEIDATETEVLIELNWHQGYVGSRANENTHLTVADGEEMYSYSDVFCIKKAGTTIQFLDDNQFAGENAGKAADDVLVLSSWVEKNGEWVVDPFGPMYAGSSAASSDIVSYLDGNILYTYTTTNDNEYLRICYHSGETANFKPAEHIKVSVALTGEEGTAKAYLAQLEWAMESAQTSYYPILDGLTVNAIGDSYIAPSNTEIKWPELMRQKYFLDLTNQGIGGGTVSNYITTKNPMCDRYQKMPNNDPDIVIIEGGRNDFNNKVPIGTWDSKDTTTYMGALNVIVEGLQEKYPNAMFVFISVWNFPDKDGYSLTHKDYVQAMEIVATLHGAYFFDSSDVSLTDVDMSNENFRKFFCRNADDPSHLNNEGSKLFFPNIEKALAEFYADFLSKQS